MDNKELFNKAKSMMIQDGIDKLKKFGQENVTEDNILTDIVYSSIFKRILENNRCKDSKINLVIDDILLDMFNKQCTSE